MHKKIALLLMLWAARAGAQVTFSEDVAPIIFEHCTKCHRDGEIAPFPLTNYAETAAMASIIEYVTGIRYMPPWTPDHTYTTFRDENVLTDAEIATIAQWVADGAPEGNPALTPPTPVFPTGSQVGEPDLVLTMEQAYVHQGNNQDMHKVFVLPTGLTQDTDIEAIEVRPDNKDICHHAILGVDISGEAAQLDAATAEYGYTQFGGFGFNPIDNLFSAWVPGSSPLVFPPTLGKKLYANSDLLVQMHYGMSSIEQSDQSSVNIFFADQPIVRYVQTATINPTDLDEQFYILPGEVKTFHGTIDVPIDVSLIDVAPHGHLICKSYEVFATSPSNQDTIKIIKIPEWDFNWQGLFAFPNLTRIPAGYTVHCIGTFDNTADNPTNPNDPPQLITWGESTTDEMYLCFLQYVLYLPGDENISLPTLNEEYMMVYPKEQLFPCYPNPAFTELTIGYHLLEPRKVSLDVLDLQGRIVASVFANKSMGMGYHRERFMLNELENGTYIYRLHGEGIDESQRFIVQR
ncbi:MAG: T9SS type A sorting domain-containing protein [Flavobacteriales bacterium]